jgi:hypothetical protein
MDTGVQNGRGVTLAYPAIDVDSCVAAEAASSPSAAAACCALAAALANRWESGISGGAASSAGALSARSKGVVLRDLGGDGTEARVESGDSGRLSAEGIAGGRIWVGPVATKC